jgi:SnoaL-like protein
MNAQGLGEIERIKQLKARYFRLLDEKRWQEWARIRERRSTRSGPGCGATSESETARSF